jgi:predicted amidohydrolase YtcJ
MTKNGRIVLLCLCGFASACNNSDTASNIEVAAEKAPDTIYVNGNVVTVDNDFSYSQALAITGDKFVAVGSSDAMRKLAGPDTKVVDLMGLTVIPGLTDNHLHSAGGGPGVDLSRARSLDEVLALIKQRAEGLPQGELVITNGDWHEAQLAEQRLPLRRDLDDAAPNHPVVVVRGGHEYILNSAALEKWNVSTETPVPDGGRITRYPDGELNGELVDTAKRFVTLPHPPQLSLDEMVERQANEYKTLNAVGLTAVRHPGGSIEQYNVRKELQKRGLLTMRVTQLLSVARNGEVAKAENTVKGWGLKPDDGGAMLRIGGIKLGVDGGFEGGFMREPYAEPWDNGGTFYGLQTVPQQRFNNIVMALNRLGWRVFTHAVGDAAIDQVLTGYEAANAEESIVGERWGIEHGFIPQPDQFERINALGLYLSVQNHLYVAGPSLVQYWGPKRAGWTTPVKAYLDAGVPVSGGTDSPVIPYPPAWVIYHFVTRDTITGGVMGPDQAISREAALRLVTRNYPYLTFEEDSKGTIEPGKYADMVVLDRDIMTVPAEEIEEMKVLLTVVGGNVVYQNDAFPADGQL